MPWLLVSGDFTPLGGMDRANHALASYLAGEGAEVHLVTHRAWPDLEARPGVTVHRVPRPLGSHLLGQSLLDHAGRRRARAAGARRGAGGRQRRQLPLGRHQLGPLRPRRLAAPRRARPRGAAADQGGRGRPAIPPRRARRHPAGAAGRRQLGADPPRRDRGPRRPARAGPHGLLRRRPRAVPAARPRGARRGPVDAGLGRVRRPAGGRLRRRAGRRAQGVRHPVRGLAAARAATRAGTPGSSSSGPGRRCRPGGRAPRRRAWATRSGSSASATTCPACSPRATCSSARPGTRRTA